MNATTTLPACGFCEWHRANGGDCTGNDDAAVCNSFSMLAAAGGSCDPDTGECEPPQPLPDGRGSDDPDYRQVPPGLPANRPGNDACPPPCDAPADCHSPDARPAPEISGALGLAPTLPIEHVIRRRWSLPEVLIARSARGCGPDLLDLAEAS